MRFCHGFATVGALLVRFGRPDSVIYLISGLKSKELRHGRLAQPVRAPALQAGGPRFEPATAHHLESAAYSFRNWTSCIKEQGVETASPLPFASVRSSYSHLRGITTTAITLLNTAQTQSALQTIENPVSFGWLGRPTQKLIGKVGGMNEMLGSQVVTRVRVLDVFNYLQLPPDSNQPLFE